MNLNKPPYMDDFDPEKDYVRILAVPDVVSQAREFTQVQTMFDYRLQMLANTFYKNGQVLDGCLITVAANKTSVQISPGKIYAEGFVISFLTPTQIQIQGSGTEIIGIVKEETIITELDDPSLRDPHAGYSNYNEPGCHRLKNRWVWSLLSDTGYGVFNLTNGILPGAAADPVKASNPQPKAEVQNVLDIIAKRDFDKSGNYVLSGLKLKLLEHPDFPLDKKQLVVESGTVRIQGYDITLIKDAGVDVELARGTAEILSEPWSFTPYDTTTQTGGAYLLGEKPVATVDRVIATVLAVDGYGSRNLVTRGQVPGGKDDLSETSVETVLSINQGGTWNPDTESFVGGTTFSKSSYLVDGSSIDWSPGGAEPDPGSSYSVAYKYRKQLSKQIMEAKEVQKELLVHDDAGDQVTFGGNSDRFVCEDNAYTSYRVLVNKSTVTGPPLGDPGTDFTTDFIRDTDFSLNVDGKVDWYDYQVIIKQITKGSLNSIDNFTGMPAGYETYQVLDIVYYDDPNNEGFDETTQKFISPSVRYTQGVDFNWTPGINQVDWSSGGGANEPPVATTYFVALSTRRYKSNNHPGYGEPYYICYWYWDIKVSGDYLSRDSFFIAWDGVRDPNNTSQHFGLDLESEVNFYRSYNYLHRVGHLDTPYPNSLVEVDYSYYLPRYVLVEFNKLDPIKLIYGNSSLKPSEPVYDATDGAILIGKIFCEADSLNMQLTQLGVRTLKVVDLQNMKDRIVQTEQNLAQTWLDLDAKSFPIDQKKGVLTTSFSNNDKIDQGWPGVAYSIDPDWEQLAFPHNDSFYSLDLDSSSTTAKLCDRICIMKPTSEETIDQSYYTSDESLAPYALADQGAFQQAQNVSMKLKPSGDTIVIPRPLPTVNTTATTTSSTTPQTNTVTTSVTAPIARWTGVGVYNQKAITYKDKMYVLGGTGQSASGKMFRYFDFKGNAWGISPDMPLVDQAPSFGTTYMLGTSPVIYNDKLYTWSGVSTISPSVGTSASLSILQIYDFNTGTWQTSNYPVASIRDDHACVVYNGKMFVFGGIAGFGQTDLNDVEIFDFTTSTWTLHPYTTTAGKRYVHCATVLNDKIYVITSMSISNGAAFKAYLSIYNPTTMSWDSEDEIGTSGITWPGTAMGNGLGIGAYYDGKVYFLIWPVQGSTTLTSDLLYSFDLATKTWTRLVGPSANPRYSYSVVVYDKKLYYFGGLNIVSQSSHQTTEAATDFLIYDLVGNQWLDSTVLNTTVVKTITTGATTISTPVPSGASVTVGSTTVTGTKTVDEAIAWATSDVAKLANPTRWFSKGNTSGTEQRTVDTNSSGGIQSIASSTSKQNEVFTANYVKNIHGNCRQVEVEWEIPGGLIKPDVMELDFFMYFGGIQVETTLLDGTPSGSASGSFMPKPDGSAKGSFLIPPNISEGRIEVKAISNPVIINDSEWRQTVVAIYDAAVSDNITMVYDKCRCNCWCHCVCNCWNCTGRCGTGPLAETLESVGQQRVLKGFTVDFTKVHPIYGVYGCVITTENGSPTSNSVASGILARKLLTADELAGAGRKTFLFDDPLFMDNTTYALVLNPEDGFNINSIAEVAAGRDIRCKIATLGQQDLISGKTVGSQPFKDGVLWKSLTGISWQMDQQSDLTFSANFYQFSTSVENIVYLQPMTVNSATAFICQWNSQIPDGTKIVFEYKTQDSAWTEYTPYQLVHLPEVTTTLYFRARLSTSNTGICPFVERTAGLMTQSIHPHLTAVTDLFDVDPSDVLDIWIDSHLPTGCTQVLRATFDGGTTWTDLAASVDGLPAGNLVELTLLNANSGQEFYRYHWKVELDATQKFTSFRIEVRGDSTGVNAPLNDLRFARLVAIASLA